MRPPSPLTVWHAEQAALEPKKTSRPRRGSPDFRSGSSSASRACCCSAIGLEPLEERGGGGAHPSGWAARVRRSASADRLSSPGALPSAARSRSATAGSPECSKAASRWGSSNGPASATDSRQFEPLTIVEPEVAERLRRGAAEEGRLVLAELGAEEREVFRADRGHARRHDRPRRDAGLGGAGLVAPEPLQDVVEVAAAGRAGRGDRLPHDPVVAILQAAAQGLHPGGRQLPRGGPGHRLDQEEPGRGGGVLPPQCRGDELLDFRGLGEGQHRVAQPFPPGLVQVVAGRPSPEQAGDLPAPTRACRDDGEHGLLQGGVGRVQERDDLLPGQLAAVHLVERDQGPAADARAGIAQPLEGRRAIGDLDERVDQRVIQEAIVLGPKAVQQGRHRLATIQPAQRRGRGATGGRLVPGRHRQQGRERLGDPVEAHGVGGAEPDAQVRIAERLAEGRPGLGGDRCA